MSQEINRRLNVTVNNSQANSALGDTSEIINDIERGTNDLGRATNNLGSNSEKSFSGINKSLRTISASIKASAIGLFLIALSQLKEIFSSSQPVVDAYNTGINFLKVSFNTLSSAIKGVTKTTDESFGEKATRKLKNYLTNIGSGIGNIIKGGKDLIKGDLVGFFNNVSNAATKAFKGVKELTGELVNEAKLLTQLEKDYAKYSLQQERLTVTYEKQAEELRQIRDNTDLDINRRIEANDKLSQVLIQQGKAEINIKLKSIENLKKQQELTGITEESTNQIFQLNTDILAIENKITGQKSEQKTNAVSLKNELKEINKIEKDGILERNRLQRDNDTSLMTDDLKRINKQIDDAKNDLDKARKDLELFLKDKYIEENISMDINVKSPADYLLDSLNKDKIDESIENKIPRFTLNTVDIVNQVNEFLLTITQYKTAIEKLQSDFSSIDDEQSARKLELIINNERLTFDERYKAIRRLELLASESDSRLFTSEIARNEFLQDLSNQRIAIAQTEADFKNEIQNSYLDSTSLGLSLLRSEFEKNKDVQAGLIIAESAVGVARTVINTVAGNQRAIAELGPIVGAPFVTANTVAGGVGIAQNLLSTRKALQALKRGGGSSTPTSINGAPQFNIVESNGTNQLSARIGQQQNQPVQAYVVGSAVTSQQALDRNILNNSTFL